MDRYLLSSQVFVEFFKRSDPAVTDFLKKVGSKNAYISTLTVGIVRAAIDAAPAAERRKFERYFLDGLQALKGCILPVDEGATDQWAIIRPCTILRHQGGDTLGEDEKLIIATAMNQGMIFLGQRPVTDPPDQLENLGFMTRDPWLQPWP